MRLSLSLHAEDMFNSPTNENELYKYFYHHVGNFTP